MSIQRLPFHLQLRVMQKLQHLIIFREHQRQIGMTLQLTQHHFFVQVEFKVAFLL